MAGGKITRIVGGKSTTIVEEDFTGYYKDLTMNAGGKNIFTAQQTHFGTPKEPEKKDGYFVKGWWSSDVEGNQKIREALVGETVYFHLETRNIPNAEKVRMTLWDDDVKRAEEEKDDTQGSDKIELYPIGTTDHSKDNESKYGIVHNNKIVRMILLNDYFSKLIEEEEDKAIELFFACSYNGQNIELPLSFGDYLKVGGKVVVFFIGGAGDKRSYLGSGPNHNILYAKTSFDKLVTNKNNYKSYYLGYYEVFGKENIRNNVEKFIDKHTHIYVVGHSLGGWNGAHLSQILADNGYNVEMLITLDPVGEGIIVGTFSDIYYDTPIPKAGFWINVFVSPEAYNFSDFVADLGGQWLPEQEPDISYITKENHLDADLIFQDKINSQKSAEEYLINHIEKYIKI